MKRTIRILQLYPELLDLYGDGGNLLVVTRRLQAMGHEVICDFLELSQKKELNDYDLIAVGAGKTRNLAAAMKDFSVFGPALSDAVETGHMVLATGTGMLLLGQGLRIGEENIPGAGLFDFEGTETGRVTVSDCILRMEGLQDPLYGFANQTVAITYSSRPNLFEVLSGTIGQQGSEGMIKDNCFATAMLGPLLAKDNCFATAMLGPLLAKNPALCRLLLQRLLGKDFVEYDDTLARTAWKYTMAEFPTMK